MGHYTALGTSVGRPSGVCMPCSRSGVCADNCTPGTRLSRHTGRASCPVASGSNDSHLEPAAAYAHHHLPGVRFAFGHGSAVTLGFLSRIEKLRCAAGIGAGPAGAASPVQTVMHLEGRLCSVCHDRHVADALLCANGYTLLTSTTDDTDCGYMTHSPCFRMQPLDRRS